MLLFRVNFRLDLVLFRNFLYSVMLLKNVVIELVRLEWLMFMYFVVFEFIMNSGDRLFFRVRDSLVMVVIEVLFLLIWLENELNGLVVFVF